MRLNTIISVLVVSAIAMAKPLKQITRQQVIRRLATRSNTAKRGTNSPIPILCGSSQTFVLRYPKIEPSPQSQKYVKIQPDRDYYGSYGTAEIVATADTAQLGTKFRLDERCRLIVADLGQFAGYYLNSYTPYSNYRLYLDAPSTIVEGYDPAQCQISLSSQPRTLSCTSGVKDTFNICPIGKLKDSGNDPLYIGQKGNIPRDCYTLTLGVTLV